MEIPIYIRFVAPVIKTVGKRFDPPVIPEVPTLVPADSLLHHSHTTELIDNMNEEYREGREFIQNMANTASWYDGSKGNIVNSWA